MPNVLGDSDNYIIRTFSYIIILSFIIINIKAFTEWPSLVGNAFTLYPTILSLFELNILGFVSSAIKYIRYYTTFHNRSADANYSTSTGVFLLNPWFITGFVDAL